MKNGAYKAKQGCKIKTIIVENIPMNNFSWGEPSGIQYKLLNMLKDSNSIELDKRMYNIEITMKDLSVLTAITELEYALFERSDKYLIFKGSIKSIGLSNREIVYILKNKFNWVGHTHPGNTFLSLIPSDGDINALIMLRQDRSAIYNSVGMYYIFGREKK